MPATNMTVGPFPLTRAHVTLLTAGLTGAYALSRSPTNDPFVVHYAGRSDSDIKRRLLDHVNDGRYLFAKCGYTTSAKAAFEWECRVFHDFGGAAALDNHIHPDRPRGSDWSCPRCTIFG